MFVKTEGVMEPTMYDAISIHGAFGHRYMLQCCRAQRYGPMRTSLKLTLLGGKKSWLGP